MILLDYLNYFLFCLLNKFFNSQHQNSFRFFLPGVSLLQVLPGLCSGQPDTLNFNGDLQQLYAAVVVAQGNAQTRKRKLSEQEDEQQGEESVAAVASTPGLFEFRCLNF